VHRFRGELPNLDDAARLAAEELTRVAGDPPQLDLALVGFGDDGHVASIFPGASLSGSIAAVLDAPKPPPRRLTMTLPVIAGAGRVVVAGFGPSKAHAMREALGGAGTPLGELLRRARAPVALLDNP
jgi:6-phosphogluconolactonase